MTLSQVEASLSTSDEPLAFSNSQKTLYETIKLISLVHVSNNIQLIIVGIPKKDSISF